MRDLRSHWFFVTVVLATMTYGVFLLAVGFTRWLVML